MSRLYTFKAFQKIPADRETVWEFISSPANLRLITPPSMGFEMLTEAAEQMFRGQIIAYNVRPLFGVKLNWVTEITDVKEKEYFVDEQRSGPYTIWRHRHFLKPLSFGVEMQDEVNYKIPFSFIGDAANYLLVRKRIRQIFDYRYRALEEKFGKYESAMA